MNGRQLRAIRKRLGVSQAKLAVGIGLDPNTIARYERDELAVPEPTAKLVRIIDRVVAGKPVEVEFEFPKNVRKKRGARTEKK